MKLFNRNKLLIRKLSERQSKSDLSILINPESQPIKISKDELAQLKQVAVSMKESKKNNAPIILAFGAHLIKNGLSKIIIELMKQGYINHIIANGAITIHDWELAYQGKTEEDVKFYISHGQFGIWQETGYYINKAINKNKHLGYGRALGKFIWKKDKLHPNKEISIIGQAYNLKIPVSICPGIGYDIIYTHPECKGSSIGIASYKDFLKVATTLTNFEKGTYISIGSAITSPMVFEKALSMAKNIALQEGKPLDNYNIYVNDIQQGSWDWSKGEPGKDNPAYYLRFMKTFSRMGGYSKYIEMDNVKFLHNLYHLLKE